MSEPKLYTIANRYYAYLDIMELFKDHYITSKYCTIYNTPVEGCFNW